MKQTEFPIEVKRGSATVRIRRVCPSKKYPDYFVFVLDYHEDGKRRRPSFATLKEARKGAEDVAERLARGDSKTLVRTGNERLLYLQAVEALHPHGMPLGVAAAEFAQAMTILKGRGSVVEAARHFAAVRGGEIKPVSVRALVDDLVRTRKANHASKRHLDDLRSRLERFASSFHCDIHLVRPDAVQDFLSSLKLQPRTINNFRISISNLFAHARLRGHVARDFNPLEGLPWAKECDQEVGIYTPEQLQTMFAHARREMIPYLALGAFAGLRQAEIGRWQWEQVKADHIVVMGALSKPGEKRLVPILPNLAAWLEPHRRTSGLVVQFANVNNQLGKLLQSAALESVHNGLRHSFGSHRLAVLKSPDHVACEMGSSKQMVFKHYRRVVAEVQGVRWFSLFPDPTCQPVFRLPPPAPLAQAA